MVILGVALLFNEIRDNKVVDAAFRAMRPAVVALIVAPIIGLAKGMHYTLIAVSVAVAAAVWYWGLSPIYFIATAIVAGIIYALVVARKEGKR